MNARIRTLVEAAEACLPEGEQDDLADILEEFVASRSMKLDFTAAELEHLKIVAAEPFVAADPDELAKLFARCD